MLYIESSPEIYMRWAIRQIQSKLLNGLCFLLPCYNTHICRVFLQNVPSCVCSGLKTGKNSSHILSTTGTNKVNININQLKIFYQKGSGKTGGTMTNIWGCACLYLHICSVILTNKNQVKSHQIICNVPKTITNLHNFEVVSSGEV